MARSQAVEVIQWGLESVAGTGVAANQRYLGLVKLTPKTVEEKTRYRGAGSEVPNGESQEKGHSEWDGEGPVCYKFLPVLLNGLLGNDASSPFSYTPNAFGADTIKTYTVEKGPSGGTGDKAAYFVVKNLRLRFTKKDTSCTFSAFARTLQNAQAMTATPTKVPCVPVDPKKVQLLIGADEEGLGATKWHEIEVNIGDRSAPHFAGNTDQESFEEHVKVANEHTIVASIEDPTLLADLFAASRAKELRCVQVKATSALEASEGNFYDLELTAMAFVQIPDPGHDADAIVAAQVTFVMTYDATFGGFLKGAVVNA